jgi:hypothetical protein
MRNKILIAAAIILIAAGLIYYFALWQGKTPTTEVSNFEECVAAGYPVMESYPRQCRTPDGQNFVEDIGNELEKADLIKIASPRPNETISSPWLVQGEARGNWFFEASFPVKLFDSEGNLLAASIAQAKSDWMTTDFVPFEAELTFEIIKNQKGTLVLQKDNPSGLPEYDDELRVPVFLEKATQAQQIVELFYYNPDLDKDETGNTMCSRQGLVGIKRKIPITQTPIQDTVRLLLKGELTQAERALGITTEYPLAGLELTGASLKDGVLTLQFNDPQNKTSGGSCRVGILWFQIEKTCQQFSQVTSVRFMPEELFQP